MSIRTIRYDQSDYREQLDVLLNVLRAGGLTAAGAGQLDVPAVVRDVIADVRSRGDQAVIDLTAKIENVALSTDRLRVSAERIAEAHSNAEPEFLDLITRSARNIREYQYSILHRDPPMLRRGGRRLGVRYTPIRRVGVYVPGGQALYPSTVLMTVVPAQVAGVSEVVMVSPPTGEGGDIDPMVLALAGELGVAEVYRVSGTAGIAAMAWGTDTIRPVSKIVGPGNAFIAEAKRQVMGRVGIDSIAGPSEVLIVADDSAIPAWVAADLLAQAEHNPGSAVLVTPSTTLVEAVLAELAGQLGSLERADAIREALARYSGIVITPTLDAACALADEFATEHLQIITADPDDTLAKIHNAGAVFLGPYTPVPLGDYYAGPSHVLPTGGTARFFGPLSCNDFLKASSLVQYDADALRQDAADVIDFATREGLTAHGAAVRRRIDHPGD
ncbi:MAG: histidinol dehydrogenase [Phycisphaerae bacterium]